MQNGRLCTTFFQATLRDTRFSGHQSPIRVVDLAIKTLVFEDMFMKAAPISGSCYRR